MLTKDEWAFLSRRARGMSEALREVMAESPSDIGAPYDEKLLRDVQIMDRAAALFEKAAVEGAVLCKPEPVASYKEDRGRPVFSLSPPPGEGWTPLYEPMEIKK